MRRPGGGLRPGTPLLALLAVLALNALVFGVYTLPGLLQERSLAARASTLRAEVERERALAARLRERAEIIRTNRQDMDRFYSEVLGERRAALTSTLQEIDRLAREMGVQSSRQSYDQEEVKGAPLVRFVITMPVVGDYRQVVSFLERLERSRRFFIVDRVDLRERQGSGQAELSVVLSAYFRADVEARRAS